MVSETGKGIKFGIVPKLLISILVPLFVILSVMGLFLGFQGASTIEGVMRKNVTAASQAAANEVDAYLKRYEGITDSLAATQLLQDIVGGQTGISGNEAYNELLNTLRMIYEDNQDEIAFVWVADFRSGELLQSDGALYGRGDLDFATRDWYIKVMEKQDSILTGAYDSISSDESMVTMASPVFVNGEIQGVVGMDLSVNRIDQLILSQVKIGDTGYITFYDTENNILYHPDENVLGTNAVDANYSDFMLQAIVERQSLDAVRYNRNGTDYYGSTIPLTDFDYMVLGVMPVAEFTQQITGIVRILVIGVVLCGLILAAICVLVALSVTRPLARLNTVVGRLADGELDVDFQNRGSDEVAALGNNVSRIVERLREYIRYIDEIAQVLAQISQGNLVFTLHNQYAGEFAKVKEALLTIQRTLSTTLLSIAQSADQVNMGAEQIANGAQALAQGATEQASSVQELSAAVQDLSRQANEESLQAEESGNYLHKINEEVEKSNEQMELMRKAMDEISTQSSAIGSIIKTIDDIAFQTNILALNAAVEAARAGTAGKGFAVVADEVRNLAAKSAAAAKETNDLIASSIQAVKNGEQLTELTAQSLEVVGKDISHILEIVSQVAGAYRDQAGKLSEIATGVDQIANVVQTNSATAEQSAAASEELSGQAGIMRQQVLHFKLEGSCASGPSVPAELPAGLPLQSSEDKY